MIFFISSVMKVFLCNIGHSFHCQVIKTFTFIFGIFSFVFLFADFIHMAVAHCMVHQVLPRNFTLPCMLLNETVLSPFSAGVVESWSGLRREHGAAETNPPLLMNEESFLCCLWSDNNVDCSLYRASMQPRMFIPSEISISASQERGRFFSQRHGKLLVLQKKGSFVFFFLVAFCFLF